MSNRKVEDVATEFFGEGFNCAESVLMSVANAMGIREACIPRIATGFGAGMACQGEVCGALTGGIMALGLKFGRERADDDAAKKATYAKCKELMQAFEDEFDGVQCREITGCDFRIPEEFERFRVENLHKTLCPKFVAFTARESLRIGE